MHLSEGIPLLNNAQLDLWMICGKGADDKLEKPVASSSQTL